MSRRKNTFEDVWKFIGKAAKDECWVYTGKLLHGYGQFCCDSKTYPAHRVVYRLTYGQIEDKTVYVIHKCNNKKCCNPKHLTLGSNSKNQRHAVASNAFQPGVSGIRGVYFMKKAKRWLARGKLHGKRHRLYYGDCLEKAIKARKQWEKENLVTFNI